MHTWSGRFLIAMWATLWLTGAALAETRIALVVGNSDYRSAGVPALPNAARDSELMAARLSETGFDVTHIVDANQFTLKAAIARFGQTLRDGGRDATGLFYYAGHAVQSFGINYLLPTDTALKDPADLDLVAIDASAVLRQMSSARNRTNIMVLDACRNNPFESMPALNESGLAEMRAPTGTFLAYATAPGDVALDGNGEHSPFTAALASQILTPGVSIEETFRRVRIEVLEETLGRQTPWDTSSLTREFEFVPGAAGGLAAEAQAFAAAQALGTVEAYATFLTTHPSSIFAEAARMERDALVAGPAPAENDQELVFSPVTPGSSAASPLPSEDERVWASVRQSQDPVEVALFLRAYPNSRHVDDARRLLANTARSAVPGSEPAEGTPAPSPTPRQPSHDENALLAAARASQSAADYEAYLAAYPNGVFAELARLELDAIRANSSAPPPASSTETQTAALTPEQQSTPQAPATPPSIGFDQPLSLGGDGVRGKSIAQLIAGSPLFPPVEGLPEAYWKNQQCSNCHSWESANLCTQAKTYLKVSAAEAGAKRHPYGGSFKQGLRQWAEAGCP